MRTGTFLFCGAMVRSLLKLEKRMTRRIMRKQPHFLPIVRRVVCVKMDGEWQLHLQDESGMLVGRWETKQRWHKPGTVVWVKETYMPMPDLNAKAFYRATDPLVGGKWKPSIFMPKKYARLACVITGVRGERLQHIVWEDAILEGMPLEDPVVRFREVWNGLNGKKAPWEVNPWVWVYEFDVRAISRDAHIPDAIPTLEGWSPLPGDEIPRNATQSGLRLRSLKDSRRVCVGGSFRMPQAELL